MIEDKLSKWKGMKVIITAHDSDKSKDGLMREGNGLFIICWSKKEVTTDPVDESKDDIGDHL